MSQARRLRFGIAAALAALVASLGAGLVAQGGQSAASIKSAMNNPYRMVENWPSLGQPGAPKGGAAIGIVPDGKGGVWLNQRADPPLVHLDASGKALKTF